MTPIFDKDMPFPTVKRPDFAVMEVREHWQPDRTAGVLCLSRDQPLVGAPDRVPGANGNGPTTPSEY